ncbi:Rgg family transcriptional regulator [Enterococcus sp. LJL128]
MEALKTGDLFRFFRLNNKQKQKELLDTNVSTYSRIENNTKAVNIEEFNTITDRLSITSEEFIRMSDLDKKQNDFISLFRYCSEHPKNNEKKKRLLSHYYNKSIEKLNLRELNNYIAIKLMFCAIYEEVEDITEEEKEYICTYIEKRTFLTHYDYNLLLNASARFNKQQAKRIVKKAIPVKNELERSHKTIIFAYNVMRNIITMLIYKNDYETAEKYIAMTKEQPVNSSNYEQRMNIEYLHNLVQYLKTGKKEYSEKITRYIRTLEDLGLNETAKVVDEEYEYVITNKGKEVELGGGNHPIRHIKEN